MPTDEIRDRLIDAAAKARESAYAPYSSYKVGAALLDEKGRVHVGVNVENVAFGSTICAERNSITRMVADGGRKIRGLAVVTKDGGTPCGACLQVIREFASEDLPIWLTNASGDVLSLQLIDFLPLGFESKEVKRTL